MQQFNGKSVVITGGSSGIGYALAKAFALEGARVLIIGPQQEKLEARTAALQKLGLDVSSLRCDVSQSSDVRAMADHAFELYDQVDILVNNAGVGQVAPLHKITEQDWDWVINVNLKGMFLVAAEFVRRFLQQNGEALIVNTGSEQCFGLPGTKLGSMYPYVSSKHGLLGFSEMMARDYAADGIRVCLLCPGPVATEIWNAGRSRQAEYGGPTNADAKLGEQFAALGISPEDVAAMTLEGIKRGEDIIITHSYIRKLVEDRHKKLSIALDNTDAWWAERD